MSAGQPHVGWSKIGVGINRLLEVSCGLLLFFLARAFAITAHVIIASQIGLQNFGIHWPRLWQRAFSWPRELRLNLASDVVGHVAFERKYIARISFVTLGPDVSVRRAIKELHGDTHSVAGMLHRSLDDAVDVQFSCDFWERFLRLLVLHRRRSRDHFHTADLREVSDQCVSHSIRKIFLCRVGGEILERKYSERADRGYPSSAKQALAKHTHIQHCQHQSQSEGYCSQPPLGGGSCRRIANPAWQSRQPVLNSSDRRDRHDQPVTPLGYGLNDAWVPGVVFEDATQLKNAPLQRIITNERARPNLLQQPLLWQSFICMPGQAHQHLHHLGLEMSDRAVAGDGVQTGVDQPGTDSEAAIHDRLQLGGRIIYPPFPVAGKRKGSRSPNPHRGITRSS